MKKRLLAVLLCAVMALSLGACGDSNTDDTQKDNDKNVKQPSITNLADYSNIPAILDEIAEENAKAYFTQVVYEAGIGLTEVKDRDVVKAGDIVATDYTGYVDGVAFKGGSTISDGKSNPQYIDVSNNCGVNSSTGATTSSFIDGFADGLIGAQKNVDKNGEVTFPDGYGTTTLVDGDDDATNDKSVDLSKKEVTFVFNVKAIYVETTPENITDAMVAQKFAQSYGASTVDELMSALKEEIQDQIFQSYFSEVVYNAGVNLVEVKDRDTVQAGDIIKGTYVGYYDGVVFEGSTSSEQWIDVDSNAVIDASTGSVSKRLDSGLSNAFIGAKIGEEKSVDVTLSSTYGTATLVDGDEDSKNDVKVDLSGKAATYKFNVKGIYIEVTPETITDEIVAENFSENYEVSTAADFLKLLEKELSYNYIMNYIIENSTFDISTEYLDSRVDEYQELFEEVYCTTYDFDTMVQAYYGSADNARVQWAASLQSQIKAELLLEAIVKEASLKVDEKGLEEYVNGIIKTASSEEGNSYFAKEENIYKMFGRGNAECGKAYYLNDSAVRDYMIGNLE